jgi:hypothetical protein
LFILSGRTIIYAALYIGIVTTESSDATVGIVSRLNLDDSIFGAAPAGQLYSFYPIVSGQAAFSGGRIQ